jgi:hypothetical protein
MIPVLKYDVGGDRSQVLEGPVCCATCDDCLAPVQDPSMAAVWNPKAGKLTTTRTCQGLLAVPEVGSVGFDHVERFVLDARIKSGDKPCQRGRPHAASSATFCRGGRPDR